MNKYWGGGGGANISWAQGCKVPKYGPEHAAQIN